MNGRKIMAAAKKAKDEVLRNPSPSEGQRAFAELEGLVGHPDGMICFKRGEAWEGRREYGLAAADYRKAKELFPLDIWKRRAEERQLACEVAAGGTQSQDSELPF